jgi:hypothetical protein
MISYEIKLIFHGYRYIISNLFCEEERKVDVASSLRLSLNEDGDEAEDIFANIKTEWQTDDIPNDPLGEIFGDADGEEQRGRRSVPVQKEQSRKCP